MRALMDEHQYGPSQMYNMDESGFAVGASQTSRALVNVRDKTSWKKIQGRQEWITAIELVDAAGVVGPPLLIFKSKHLSTVPDHAPPDWSFTTSKSGWTSDSHGYRWLTDVFEPWTRRRLPDPAARRMLIMDGHSHRQSHIILHAECHRPAYNATALLTCATTTRCERFRASEACSWQRDRQGSSAGFMPHRTRESELPSAQIVAISVIHSLEPSCPVPKSLCCCIRALEKTLLTF